MRKPLWMISKKGFSAYGLDLSEEVLKLGQKMLDNWGAKATLKRGSMTEIPWRDETFDAVIDVFSAYCLDEEASQTCLKEASRILKPGSRFFFYTPGKASDAYQHHNPAEMIDASTLNGIHLKDSPYCGNHYPFRFVHPIEYKTAFIDAGLQVKYLETVVRSYNWRKEEYEHVVVEATK